MSDSMMPLPPTYGVSDPQVRSVLDAVVQNIGVVRDEYVNASNVNTYVVNSVTNLFSGSGTGTSNGKNPVDQVAQSILQSELYRRLNERIEDIILPTSVIAAIGELDSLAATLQNGITQINTVTSTSTSATARSLYALQQTINDPTTGYAVTRADIIQLNYVNVSSTSANARTLAGLSAVIYDPTTGYTATRADIAEINNVSATSSSASARSVYANQSALGIKGQIYFQTSAPTNPTGGHYLTTDDWWVDSADNNTTYKWNGYSWVNAALTGGTLTATSLAAINTESTTRVNKDMALASVINTLWSTIGGSSSIIQDGSLASATPVSATTTKWNQVVAAVTDPNTGLVSTTSIKQDFQTYANSANGTMNASYTVRINSNNHVAGFGLMTTSGAGSSGGTTSSFIIQADKFGIVGTSGSPVKVPFSVLTATDSDGNPPGVYIDSATIKYLSVGTLHLQNQALSDHYTTNSSTAVGLTGSYADIRSLTVTVPAEATDALVIITGSVNWVASSGSDGSLYLNIEVDGTQVIETGTSVIGSFSTNGVIAYSMALGVGSHTIAMRQYQNGGWNGVAGARSLTAVVVKK